MKRDDRLTLTFVKPRGRDTVERGAPPVKRFVRCHTHESLLFSPRVGTTKRREAVLMWRRDPALCDTGDRG